MVDVPALENVDLGVKTDRAPRLFFKGKTAGCRVSPTAEFERCYRVSAWFMVNLGRTLKGFCSQTAPCLALARDGLQGPGRDDAEVKNAVLADVQPRRINGHTCDT